MISVGYDFATSKEKTGKLEIPARKQWEKGLVQEADVYEARQRKDWRINVDTWTMWKKKNPVEQQ